MSPTIMLKAIAGFLNVSPEEITENIEQFRHTAMNGVALLEQIDARLKRIEDKLDIPADELMKLEERQ